MIRILRGGWHTWGSSISGSRGREGLPQNLPLKSVSEPQILPPFLDVGFEKFFDSHMQNYIGKLKIIK